MGWSYVLRRLAQVIPALLTILLVTFTVIHLSPGDPAAVYAGEYATQEQLDELRRQYGLDRPMWAQFGAYLDRLVHADLGQSFAYGRPVTTVIGERLPPTLLLTGAALAVSIAVGIVMGTVAARKPHGLLDASITHASLVGYAIPAFWLGQLAIILLGVRWRLFPVLGMTDTRIEYTGLDYIADVAYHLMLPVAVMAASEVALITRLTRTGLIQEMQEGYVRTARAKGVNPRDLLAHHAFPNAALPLITVIGARVGFLFSGAVIIETVFSWPGLGLLLRNAVTTGDRPLALGLVLLVALSVLIANLVTDLIHAWTDPRIRYH